MHYTSSTRGSRRSLAGWIIAAILAGAAGGCAPVHYSLRHATHELCTMAGAEPWCWYHARHTGEILRKKHCWVPHPLSPDGFPCFGYAPTCWHPWPAECGPCCNALQASVTPLPPVAPGPPLPLADQSLELSQPPSVN